MCFLGISTHSALACVSSSYLLFGKGHIAQLPGYLPSLRGALVVGFSSELKGDDFWPVTWHLPEHECATRLFLRWSQSLFFLQTTYLSFAGIWGLVLWNEAREKEASLCFPTVHLLVPPVFPFTTHTWTYASSSLDICFLSSPLVYIPTGGIAGSCGTSVINLLRNRQTVFQSSCTILYFTDPPEMYEGSYFSISSSTLVIVCFGFVF